MRTPDGARTSHRMYQSFLRSEIPRPLRGRQFADGRFAMPARLLIGEHDPLGAHLVKGFERHGADAAWEIVDGVGHFLPEERPAVVAERARALLAAAAQAAAGSLRSRAAWRLIGRLPQRAASA